MMAAGSDRLRGRKRGALLLVLAIALAAGVVVGNQFLPASEPTAPAIAQLPDARSGTAYCPVVAGEGDTAQLEIASASAALDSEIVITRFIDGAAVLGEPRSLAAGQSAILDIPAEQLGNPVTIDWRGGPVVAQYRVAGGADQGSADQGRTDQGTATCQGQPSDRWYLSGFDTNRGNTSTLFLMNPFESDAVVTLRFGTTDGPVDLIIADELVIPAGQVMARDLSEFRPETSELAVTVEARTGRVVAQGQLIRGQSGEGVQAITGRSLIPAVASTSEVEYFPEVLTDTATDSWVTVYNPGERAAAVQVDVSTPLATAASLASELTVPAGGTTRIELAELSALPRFGIRVRSVNGVGVVATRTSAVQDGDRLGLSVAVATTRTDTGWIVVGARPPDGVISLFNPGDQVAVATVQTDGAPEEWDAVQVPPNGAAQLPLAGLDVQGPIQVTSDVPIVAGMSSLSAAAPTMFVAVTGTPVTELVGSGQAAAAERDPSLSTRPATSATATPTPAPDLLLPGGEGQLDPEVDSSPAEQVQPPVTDLPTPSPGVVQPTSPPATIAPDPPPPTEGATSGPTAEPAAPGTPPTDGGTEEGGLFG